MIENTLCMSNLHAHIKTIKEVCFHLGCLFVCEQLHKITTDPIFRKMLPEMHFWSTSSLLTIAIYLDLAPGIV